MTPTAQPDVFAELIAFLEAHPDGLKALTLHRPWDQLVLHAGKAIENRTWSTTYRGPLVIHGGKHFDALALEVAPEVGDLDGSAADLSESASRGLLGVVDLVDVCSATVTGDVECGCGPWAFPGQHHWRLANPRPLREPIPCRGRLGLWPVTGQLLAALEAQL